MTFAVGISADTLLRECTGCLGRGVSADVIMIYDMPLVGVGTCAWAY